MQKKCEEYGKECYCRRLRLITAQVTRMYDGYLKEAGITCQQFSTLVHIREMEPVSVTDLSRTMGLDRTSLSRNLKILQGNNLIIDEKEYGRRRAIVLSNQGKETLLQAKKQWELAQAELEKVIGTDQLCYLEKLEKMLCELSS